MNTQRMFHNALQNRLQTLGLLAFIGAYLAFVGWLLWGGDGLVWLLLFAGVFFLFGPTASPHLLMRFHKARPLARFEAPELYHILDGLAQRAGLPERPALYYLPGSGVNAFAVGTPGQALVAVTDGLLQTLNRRELTGVLAHEISHIRNNDLRVMGLASMAGRITAFLSLLGQVLLLINLPLVLFSDLHVNWLAVVALLFAPQLSALAQLGLSRVREYDADLHAAQLTGDPEGLALALVKLEERQRPFWRRIMTPGQQLPEFGWLRTHPATQERVRRLMALCQKRETPMFVTATPGAPFPRPAVHRPGWPLRWHASGLWH